MVLTKAKILGILEANQAEIEALGVKRLGLFGSFARESGGEDSDIDLLVEFDPDKKTFDHFMQLGTLLEDLLGRSVELVTTESLSPYLGPSILNECEYARFSG